MFINRLTIQGMIKLLITKHCKMNCAKVWEVVFARISVVISCVVCPPLTFLLALSGGTLQHCLSS